MRDENVHQPKCLLTLNERTDYSMQCYKLIRMNPGAATWVTHRDIKLWKRALSPTWFHTTKLSNKRNWCSGNDDKNISSGCVFWVRKSIREFKDTEDVQYVFEQITELPIWDCVPYSEMQV